MREGRGCVERREGVFKNCGGGNAGGSDSGLRVGWSGRVMTRLCWVCGLGLVAGREKMEGPTDMVIGGIDHETDKEAW